MYENEIYSGSHDNNNNPDGGDGNGGTANSGNVNVGNANSGNVNEGTAYSGNVNVGTVYSGNANVGTAYSGNANVGTAYSGNANVGTVNSDNNANASSNKSGSPYFDYTTYAAYPTDSVLPVTENKKKKKEKKPKKPMTGFRKVIFSAGLGLCFGLFAGAGFYAVNYCTNHFFQTEDSESRNDQVQQPPISPTLGNNVALGSSDNVLLAQTSQVTYVSNDASDVVADVMPAMVTILNTYTVTGSTIWGQTYSEQRQGGGSGIIVAESDSELLIVTNNHVVEGADELQVTFLDGSTAKASAKGLDADMDLAVIAVDLKDISSETRSAIAIATLGDSSTLRMGEPVIAIGNALGFGLSVSGGMVSALNREMTMDDGSVGIFIQTDAAINEGNSGGALLNIKGEVVGINSSKIGGSKVDNMGFAIPISSASPIIAELMERKTRIKVEDGQKGYLGIEMLAQEVPDEILALYGMPQGVYIANVQEGCAAEKAGILQRDIVVKIDGTKVTSRTELKKEMEYHAAGETVIVTIERLENGKYVSYDIEVTLGKKPEE